MRNIQQKIALCHKKLSFNASCLWTAKAPPESFPPLTLYSPWLALNVPLFVKWQHLKHMPQIWNHFFPEFEPSLQTLMAHNCRRGTDDTKRDAEMSTLFSHLRQSGLISADSYLTTHIFCPSLCACPSSPGAPWDSLWEGWGPQLKLTFHVFDKLWYWMLTRIRPPSSFIFFSSFHQILTIWHPVCSVSSSPRARPSSVTGLNRSWTENRGQTGGQVRNTGGVWRAGTGKGNGQEVRKRWERLKGKGKKMTQRGKEKSKI